MQDSESGQIIQPDTGAVYAPYDPAPANPDTVVSPSVTNNVPSESFEPSLLGRPGPAQQTVSRLGQTAVVLPVTYPVATPEQAYRQPGAMVSGEVNRQTKLPLLSWHGPTFLHKDKSATWYAVYFLVAVALIALMLFFTRDALSTVIVVIVVIALAYSATRRPTPQQYILEDDSLRVGGRTYYFNDFKAFSVDEQSDGSITLTLWPLKRLMPPVVVLVSMEDVERVLDVIADYLPQEVHKTDAVDLLLRRIHL